MDILLKFDDISFNNMAIEFLKMEENLKRGIFLNEFIYIIMKYLPIILKNTIEKKNNIKMKLIHLFNEIDTSGNGLLELNEFTTYCIDSGMSTSLNSYSTNHLKHKYIKNKKFIDKTTTNDSIDKIKWFSNLKKIFVVESKAKTVKVYDIHCKLIIEIQPGKGIISPPIVNLINYDKVGINQYHSTSTSTSTCIKEDVMDGPSTNRLIFDIVYLTNINCIASCASDFSITIFDIPENNYKYIMEFQCPSAQIMLRFCNHSSYLLSSGSDNIIYVWEIKRERKILKKQLIGHHDVVLDIIEIPPHDLIISCDIKHNILLWDVQDCRSRGKLQGHSRGIRQMIYSKTNDLLLTAGFEFEAYGWDISSRQIVMKLGGHRCSLIGVQLVHFSYNHMIHEVAITGDMEGNFRIWNINRNSHGFHTDNNEISSQLLETFHMSSSLHFSIKYHPQTFVVLSPMRTIIIGGAALYIFESKKVIKDNQVPNYVMYCPVENTFITIIGGITAYVWDGINGNILNEFHKISLHKKINTTNNKQKTSSSPLIICCHDEKDDKKIIVGSEDGYIKVFNRSNMVILRQFKNDNKYIKSIITSLHYISNEKLIICTTEDGSIHIFDEGVGEEVIHLRSLLSCHGIGNQENKMNNTIVTSAISYNGSFIATAARTPELEHIHMDYSNAPDDFQLDSIRLWDIETLKLVSSFKNNDFKMDIHLLEFLDPFPLLAAADKNGNILLFLTTNQYQWEIGTCVYSFYNGLNDPSNTKVNNMNNGNQETEVNDYKTNQPNKTDDSINETISSIKSIFDPEKKQYTLVTATDVGYIRIWDLSSTINSLLLLPLDPNQYKWKSSCYNSRAKFIRDYEEESQTYHASEGGGIKKKISSIQSSNFSKLSNRRNILNNSSNQKFRSKTPLLNGLEGNSIPNTYQNFKKVTNTVVLAVRTRDKANNKKNRDTNKKNENSCPLTIPDPVLLHIWKGHDDAISYLSIPNSLGIIISASFDLSIFVWDFHGNKLGNLTNEDDIDDKKNDEFMMRNTNKTNKWMLRFKNKEVSDTKKSLEEDECESSEIRLTTKQRNKSSLNNIKSCNPVLKSMIEGEQRSNKEFDMDRPVSNDGKFIQERISNVLILDEEKKYTKPIIHNNISLKQSSSAHLMARLPIVPIDNRFINHFNSNYNDLDNTGENLLMSRNIQILERLDKTSSCDNQLNIIEKKKKQEEKFIRMYKNYSTILKNNQNERNSLHQKEKKLDTSLSTFLLERIGPDTKKVLLKRPMTVPTLLHSCKSDSNLIKNGLKTEDKTALLKTNAKQPIHSKENIFSSDKAMGHEMKLEEKIINSNISCNREIMLKGINDIIEKTSNNENNYQNILRNEVIEANDKIKMESANVNNLKVLNETEWKNKISETVKRFDSMTKDEMKITLHEKVVSKVALDKKKRELNRMKDYLKQKKRTTNNSIGEIFRNTSLVFQNKNLDLKIKNQETSNIKNSQRFGIYTIKEVMPVIRLYWSLDHDMSGSITLNELLGSETYISKFSHADIATIFQSIDKDKSGDLSLKELLTVIFTYASKDQIDEMLQLAKIGKVKHIGQSKSPLTHQQRQDLEDLFKIFDNDKSGFVTVCEILEALGGEGSNGSKEQFGITKEDIDRLYKEFDIDGNNKLDLDEFISMIKVLYTKLPIVTNVI